MKKKLTFAILVLALIFSGVSQAKADGLPWSLYGPPSFKIIDNNGFEGEGSDLFTNPQENQYLFINIFENVNDICLLHKGKIWVFGPGSYFGVEANDPTEAFRVIDYNYWLTLPEEDGAYNLCWDRSALPKYEVFLPLISN